MTEQQLSRTQVLHGELTEIRAELRRIDAKARDLLVVATLAVTSAVAVGGLLTSGPPAVAAGGFALATVLWAAGVVQLILVIRPMLIADTVNQDASGSMDDWLYRRWLVLHRIVGTKYRRIRRAVDLLLVMASLSVLSTLFWLLDALR